MQGVERVRTRAMARVGACVERVRARAYSREGDGQGERKGDDEGEIKAERLSHFMAPIHDAAINADLDGLTREIDNRP